MVEVKKIWGSYTRQWWYVVYLNYREIKRFNWRWCAIRFARKLAKDKDLKYPDQIIFKID